MVNMPWCDRAVEEARRLGISGKIGLHLNFTEGKPLTGTISSNPTFCDRNGFFTGRFHKSAFKRFFMTKSEKQAIASEARAQME